MAKIAAQQSALRKQLNDILSLFDRQLQLSIRSTTNRLPKLDTYTLKRNPRQ